MNKLFCFCSIFIVLTFSIDTMQAQIPRTISFQGVLADAQGNLVPDGNHQLSLILYDAATNGNQLFIENQTVPVVKGIFNVIIGSVNPIPSSLTFERAYFLGVSVDGGLELIPRTALTSVPYALRAERANIAESLSPNATGVVTKVNGQDGEITLQGEGSTTVTTNGNTINISSTGGGSAGVSSVNNLTGALTLTGSGGTTVNANGNILTITAPGGGGTGIQGVQNGNNTLDVLNPNGPTATINVKNQGITSTQLADGAVTSAKIQDGQVRTADLEDGGVSTAKLANDAVTSVKIQDGQVRTVDMADDAISTAKLADNAVTSIKVASGQVVKSINTVKDNVTLAAGSNVTITPSGNTLTIASSSGGGLTLPYSGTVSSTTTGFQVINTGSGAGVSGTSNSGNGVYALSASNDGVSGRSNSGYGVSGASTSNDGVYGTSSSSGKAGVYGSSSSGTGVSGSSTSGNGVSTSSISGYGVYSSSTSGRGVYGSSSSNIGVQGQSSGGFSAVYGSNTSGIGVYGTSTSNDGVEGKSSGASGVYGESSGDFASGVFGISTSTGGLLKGGIGVTGRGPYIGVYGVGSGDGVGVQGQSVNNSAVHAAGKLSASGTKSAIVKLNTGTQVNLFCEEAAEVYFNDYGEGTLTNGGAHIELDLTFLQTITVDANHPIKVFVQLEGDCKGVFVTNKTATGCDVVELQGGTSNAHFTYRVVCKRKYFEDERLATHEQDVQYNKRMMETVWPEVIAKHQKEQAMMKAMEERHRIEQEKMKTAQIENILCK